MRLTLVGTRNGGFQGVSIEHGTHDPIILTTKTFSRIRLQNSETLFDDINDYMATLDTDIVDAIWEAYVIINECLNMVGGQLYTQNAISEQINIIYDKLNIDNLSKYLLTNGKITVPASLQDVISRDSRYTDEIQTYLKSDYINLAVFTVALRMVMPIWGNYVDEFEDSSIVGNENAAVALISKSILVNWPEHNTVVDKLRDYIYEKVKNNVTNLENTWRGISTSEMPDSILSRLLVRKLCLVPVETNDDKTIVSTIHWFIWYCLNPNLKGVEEKIRDKKIDQSPEDDKEKQSVIELHKIKHKVTIGNQVAAETLPLYADNILRQIDPSLTGKFIEQCRSVEFEDIPLPIAPLTLTQWVMTPVLDYRMFSHMRSSRVRQYAVIAQAVLWEWGFEKLAVYIHSNPIALNSDCTLGLPLATKVTSKIIGKEKQLLEQAYPYTKADKGNERQNYITLVILDLVEQIRSKNWEYIGPAQLWTDAGQPKGYSIISQEQDYKSILIELALKIAELNL